MKVISEMSIRDFNAWEGAVYAQDKILNANKADEFDQFIEEQYPDGIDETTLNDLLWFECDQIFDELGIENEEV